MTLVFKLLSMLPLWILHGLGWTLGWIVFMVSPEYRRQLLGNAEQAGVARREWLQSIGEAGKLAAELPRVWLGRAVPVRWEGSHYVEAALAKGGGLVFLTPHLGCFEIAAQAYAERFGQPGKPMTVLYRPARQAWLQHVMGFARTRPGLHVAPASLSGVKKLIQAMNRGHCVGLLPDQVPPKGQGAWLPFFSREAYTMTLSARLALQPDATVLLAWGERLSWGRGYTVHVRSMPACEEKTVDGLARHINRSMERIILEKPTQYLWGYARYKTPKDGI